MAAQPVGYVEERGARGGLVGGLRSRPQRARAPSFLHIPFVFFERGPLDRAAVDGFAAYASRFDRPPAGELPLPGLAR